MSQTIEVETLEGDIVHINRNSVFMIAQADGYAAISHGPLVVRSPESAWDLKCRVSLGFSKAQLAEFRAENEAYRAEERAKAERNAKWKDKIKAAPLWKKLFLQIAKEFGVNP